MDKIKKSCYNCEFGFRNGRNGTICANTYYGELVKDLEKKICIDWKLSLMKYLDFMQKFEKEDKKLHDLYLYNSDFNKLVKDYFY